MKRYLAAAMLLLALSGCGSSGSSTQLYTTTEDFFAMDTYMWSMCQAKRAKARQRTWLSRSSSASISWTRRSRARSRRAISTS
ncbi:MAG: hypothetical protein ACLT4C_09405 [Butyricicoccus sp.]